MTRGAGRRARSPGLRAWQLAVAVVLLAPACSGTRPPQTAEAPPQTTQSTAARAAPRSPTAQAADAANAPDVSRQLMVILPPGPERLWSRVMQDLADVYGLKPVFFWPLPSLGENCIIYEPTGNRSVADLLARLKADRRVELAQPVNLFRALAEGGYNDPYARLQYGLGSLKLEKAHTLATGKGVKVAVIDTGMDLAHPDLAGKVVRASTFLSWGERAFTGDVHGTAVAGVIAAGANNGQGIVGVAPGSEILALKACWQDPPTSRQAVCNSYTLAQAVDFALREGAQVLNLSLAGPEDPLLARLLAKAIAKGVSVVAASPDGGGEGFPASLPGVLAVRSSGPAGNLRNEAGAAEPAGLAAPGVDVLTTVPRDTYDFFTGSSMAAAQVSGVVALLLERRPELTPAEVATLLSETAQPIAAETTTGTNGSEERHQPAGARIVDACRALARLTGQAVCGS